jgi:hypothetical protein
MCSGHGFGRVKSGCSRRDSVRSERRLRSLRNGLLCERVRQRFERSVILQREMRAFIRFRKHEDRCCIVVSDAGRISRLSLSQREPMRIHESGCVAVPCAERRQVVAFSSHLQSELSNGAGVSYEEKV